ncbi:MAG TPA: hypothetical protein VJ697_00830 [Nitrososphaeraceae archaeon]|nr:hypothetical protein [Nitrososphaeraceae archaeon]
MIIIDNKKKIVYQVPYKFYVFAAINYPYIFKNDGEYSLSLLTKIDGDKKYEDSPLIATIDLDTDKKYGKIDKDNNIF